jgi:hypothetical protein
MTDLFGHPQDSLHAVVDPVAIKEFVLAGKAKFTLKSAKTGIHHTYKVKKGDKEVWFVSRWAGHSYAYLGAIFPEGFTHTRKSGSAQYSPAFAAFKWFWQRLVRGEPLHQLEFFHAGRCGMCGLELTDPVSVKEGYGPDCRKKRLRHHYKV